MNFARLNHILIPTTKKERDRLRSKKPLKILRPFGFLIFSLSTEGRFLLVFWLISGAMSMNIGSSQGYILWGLISGLLVASLLFARLYALSNVRIFVEVPPRVSVGDQVTFSIVLSNSGNRKHQAIRINGPFLPWDGQYMSERPALAALSPGTTERVELVATFSMRGEHHLDAFGAEALVPFAVAVGPGIETGGVKFLVVPRIAAVSAFRLPTSMKYQPGGVALASQTGESMELVGIRPYRAGDPVRDLHAASWARVGYPVVREYRQEYFTRVGVVLDTDFQDTQEPLQEAAISLVAGIVASLSRGEALIDVLLIGDKVHQLTLGRSLGFLDQALDLLACVEPGPILDPQQVEKSLAPFLSQLSYVVFVTVHWDERRERFVAGVQNSGVGLRSVRVTEDAESADVSGDRVEISRVDVETSKGLVL